MLQSLNAQKIFEVNNAFKKIEFKNYINVHSTLDSINPNYILNDTVKWEENKVSYGFSDEFFWLKFKIKNISKSKSELYLEVDNPHLSFIEFYERKNDRLILKYRCGRQLKFDTRPVDNVKFVFPIYLDLNGLSEYYIKIDKRSHSVSFPVNLWNKNEFTKVYNKVNLFNGIYFGGLILAIIYSLIAYFNIKRKLYIFYLFYIFFLGLYMYTSAGYSFQYLIQDSIKFNSYFRVVTLTLMVFLHAKFLQSLFKTKKNTVKLHKSINLFSNALLLITVVYLIVDQFDKSFVTIYLKANYLIILILIIHFLLTCIFTYKKLKKIVKLYLLSFSAIILVGIWLVFLEYGWFPSLRIDISPLYFGSLIEIITLSILLISEMRLVIKEKENLSIKIVEKQQEIVQAYIDGIEKEKLRISEELHDDIGSKLSNLNQFVSDKEIFSKGTSRKIESIINDVRSISHKLSPNKITFFSFKEQIENVVEEALFNTNIEYTLHFNNEFMFLIESQKLNIYRIIQEFLHNAIKHSKATIIEIELSKLENNLILSIEDNGVGFVVEEKKSGLGLINIQRRVDYLHGKIELSSVLNKGTFALVSIPISIP